MFFCFITNSFNFWCLSVYSVSSICTIIYVFCIEYRIAFIKFIIIIFIIINCYSNSRTTWYTCWFGRFRYIIYFNFWSSTVLTIFTLITFLTFFSLRSSKITNFIPSSITFLINITSSSIDISIPIFTIFWCWRYNST